MLINLDSFKPKLNYFTNFYNLQADNSYSLKAAFKLKKRGDFNTIIILVKYIISRSISISTYINSIVNKL